MDEFDVRDGDWRQDDDELNILRWRTDDRAVSDEISAADRDLAFDHHVRLHDRVIADCHLRPNKRKRTDLHILADFRIRIDDCGGMNFRVRHVSGFGIRTSDFCDYNTPASLKLK